VPQSAPDLGAVVARVGEVPIFAAEVAAQAARTGKAPRAALSDLIDLHLLAEPLRDRWPPADDEARALERQLVVQRLLEREFEPASRMEDMPDSAVKELYDAVADKFVHPELVEVAVLSLAPGKRARPEVRAEARRTMLELEAVVKARPEKTPEDLQAAIADARWHTRGVQYFHFMQAGDKPYTAKFGAEVKKMKTPGETAFIEDEYGFYITRFISVRPPKNQTFDMVKKELREGHYPRWRQARFQEFTRQLASSHQVEVHAAPLAATASGP
jgi:hypothetical protein